jgi:hypothetical protein
MIAATSAERILLLLPFVFTELFIISPACGQSADEIQKKALGSWHHRQNTVKSATFKIRSTLVLTERELQRRDIRQQTLHGNTPNVGDSPQGDKLLTELYEIAFDEDKLRLHMTFDKSTHELAKSVNRNVTCLFVTNGSEFRALQSFPDHGFNSGVIQNADQFPAFKSGEVEPVLLAFRSFSPHRQQFIHGLEVVDGEHEINGRPLVVMQQHNDGTKSAGVQYWMDPSRDYIVMRNLSISGDGRVGFQADIEYAEDRSGIWVPVKWTQNTFGSDGDLFRSSEFQVTAYEVNPKLPESLFELEFEPGVRVFDKREGVHNANVWTVNQDGSKRMQEGVDPDKGVDLGTGPRVWLWVTLVIVFSAVVFFVFRHRVTKTN